MDNENSQNFDKEHKFPPVILLNFQSNKTHIMMIRNRKKIFTSSFADEESLVSSDNIPRNGGEDNHEPKSTSKLIMALVLFTMMMRFMTLQTFQNHNEFVNMSKMSQFTEIGSAIEISVVILTYKKAPALAKLLPSVLKQKPSNFEIILVDNGCLDETKTVIETILGKQTVVPYKYLPLCNNPGYAAGNNAGVKLAAPTSTQILLLNDDVILSEPDFIQNMMQIAQAKTNSGAVGCKLLNFDGSEIIEAGSIIWEDASAAGYGRGRKDIDAPEFSYPRPVDYVSGACLLVNREVFEQYGGFDGKHFPNYYEDTDLQLHIQHDIKREVWLQPKSVALHDEHGSFGNEESTKLMEAASKEFKKKWSHALNGNHLPNPWNLEKKEQDHVFFKAADLRARNPTKANILYFDDKSPNKSRGSGYGRSFDNLSMLAELGHHITLVTWLPFDSKNWCDDKCVNEITSLGIEYVTNTEWDKLVESRIGYYDIVIVSRPSTFQATYEKWQYFYRQSSFSLIYDAEALWFRRDELLHEIVQSQNIQFPGYNNEIKPELMEVMIETDRKSELTLLKMADTVITVSEQEKKAIKLLLPYRKNVEVIGHIMDTSKKTEKQFSERNGILFLASFSKSMYYNGDAIWYFLKDIYPLVIQSSPSKNPVPLTIAGRGIPDELRKFVEKNKQIRRYVTFLESPKRIEPLFEEHRIFIAPHLYGSGIQYKVSEALAVGLPVVMSTFTKESFGDIPGCVGSNVWSFAKCINDIHSDNRRWEALRDEGISYIQQTHNREEFMMNWSEIINASFNTDKKQNDIFLNTKVQYPSEKCPEGEELYLRDHLDVANAIKEGQWESAFQHWKDFGRTEGRKYFCRMIDNSANIVSST